MSDPAYQSVLKLVSHWPPEMRLALAQDVLGSLKSDFPLKEAPRDTLSRALGIGRGPSEPPDDDQVKKWVDEHRNEKFGT